MDTLSVEESEPYTKLLISRARFNTRAISFHIFSTLMSSWETHDWSQDMLNLHFFILTLCLWATYHWPCFCSAAEPFWKPTVANSSEQIAGLSVAPEGHFITAALSVRRWRVGGGWWLEGFALYQDFQWLDTILLHSDKFDLISVVSRVLAGWEISKTTEERNQRQKEAGKKTNYKAARRGNWIQYSQKNPVWQRCPWTTTVAHRMSDNFSWHDSATRTQLQQLSFNQHIAMKLPLRKLSGLRC